MIEYATDSGQTLPDHTEDALAMVQPVDFVKTDNFAHLPLSAIVPSLTNPRKTFDSVKLRELATSIKASGVHQPILVRTLPGSRLQDTFDIHATGGGLKVRPIYEIVAGERRYRACVLAGVDTIPAMIRIMTDHQVLEAQIIENLQREDISPLEEAEGYDNLCIATGIKKEDVGDKIGKSRSYVYGRLKLLDLSQDCKQALRDSSIDASRALAIARIPDSALQTKALNEATRKSTYNGEVPSLREFQLWLRRNVMLHLEGAPFDTTSTQLCPKAGSCNTCPKRTGAAPDLFADVDGADICTDPPCYQAKEAAHRAQLVARAEAKGLRVIDGKEAQELFKSRIPMGGYSRLDQRRQDAGEDAPTLRKLLGSDAESLRAQGIELVLIEHPKTKELIEAASTPETEALLITRGLIQQTQAVENADRHIERLKEDIDRRVTRATRPAIFKQLVAAVHASPPERAIYLVDSELIRAWLTALLYDREEDDMATALNYQPIEGQEWGEDDLRMCIQRLPTSGLYKALAIMMGLDDKFFYGNPDQTTDVFKALAHNTGTDIEAVAKTVRNTIKAEVADEIKLLKAKAEADKKAATEPLADVAFSKGEGGAKTNTKTNTKKPKTTAAEAQAAIAAAMQAQDETQAQAAQTPEPETNQGADAQGIEAASGFALSVGTRVCVVGNVDLLTLIQHKWAGREGKITAAAPLDQWTLTFAGRNGGMANFRSDQLIMPLRLQQDQAAKLKPAEAADSAPAAQPSPLDGEPDPLYEKAVAIVKEHNKPSIALVQRTLKIGYNQAARLLEQMEQAGLITAMSSSGTRELVKSGGVA